jgi:putative heme-binding domain-containing protein
MALPGNSRIGRFTNGAVLVQTLSLGQRRVETRLLINQHGQWAGYSYGWNERQTDATLVDAKGEQKRFGSQTWRFPSRVECMTCHSRAADFVLGINEMQLNKVHDYGPTQDHQLRTLQHIGVFTGTLPKAATNALPNPYDTAQSLDARARSYLHVNCSVCHVDAGGGNSKMDLRFTVKPERMALFSARPQHDTFGIDNAMLVFPGDPDRSILYQRLSRRGRGQMPPLVTSVVDERAVALFRDWISEMKSEQAFVRDWKPDDLLPLLAQLGEGRSIENGRAAFKQTGCIQCHRFAGEGGSVGPDLTGIARRLSTLELLESILSPSKTITDGYATTEVETKSGEIISGRIEREDDRVLIMRPPTATEEMLTIRKTDIRRRALSQTSNMPTGMLNTLNESEVLDLVSYLISDSESTSANAQPR